SRRRHTISKRDWSSDVCSSDLPASILESSLFINIILLLLNHNGLGQNDDESAIDGLNIRATKVVPTILVVSPFGADACKVVVIKIGRASCREREWKEVVQSSL